MRVIGCTEGVPFSLDAADLAGVQRAVARLKVELRPRFPLLRIDEAGCRISNLIGSIDIGGAVIDVRPKTKPGDAWIESALALLTSQDRVELGGDRPSGLSEYRPSLWEALAARYVARLEVALGREGPLLLFEEHRERDAVLRGRLDVDAFFSGFPGTIGNLPFSVRQLSADNDFSRALAVVASVMSRSVRSPTLRARLSEAAFRMRPGYGAANTIPAHIETRSLPVQWAVYRPAWSIAAAIIRRRSLLAPLGRSHGIAVAFEAWPLLETLLTRALSRAVSTAVASRPHLSSHPQTSFDLLVPVDRTHTAHGVRPDGLLLEAGAPLATFEAKYRDFDPKDGPARNEIYQAVSTALAVGAPTAVLVYPNELPGREWRVVSHSAGPVRLFAVGLSMFSYRAGDEDSLGRRLLEICS